MANLNYVWPQETVNIDVTGITYPADVFDQVRTPAKLGTLKLLI